MQSFASFLALLFATALGFASCDGGKSKETANSNNAPASDAGDNGDTETDGTVDESADTDGTGSGSGSGSGSQNGSGGSDVDDDELQKFRDEAIYVEPEGMGSWIETLRVDTDGSMIAGGAQFESFTSSKSLLIKFSTDYTRDTTFGDKGKVLAEFGDPIPSAITSIFPFSDGFFVGLGNSLSDPANFGSINISTGEATPVSLVPGAATVDLSESVEETVQLDDAVLALLYDKIVKIKPDGTFDTSFGTDGVTDAGIIARNLTLGNDESIYYQEFSRLHALNADGSVKSTFGTGGEYDANDIDFSPSSIVYNPTNQMLYAIELPSEDNGSSYRVIRLSETGVLDATFGTAGIVSVASPDVLNLQGRVPSLRVQSDGKILVVGRDFDDVWYIVRINIDGTIDATYGTDGVFTHKFPTDSVAQLDAIAVGPGDVFFMAGKVADTSSFLRGTIIRVSQAGKLDVK